LRKFTFLTAAVAAALTLTACSGPASSGSTGETAESAGTPVTIAMATPSCLVFYPAYVAKEQGFFAEQGLDVTIQGLNGSAAVIQAMLAGQAQIGTPGAVPMVLAQADGENFQYFANAAPGGLFQLVSPAENGMANASALSGGTIGVATADGNEVSFAKAIMTAAGVAEGDYEILVVGEGGQAVAGFQRGDIDAYAASLDAVATIEYAGIPIDNLTGTATAYLFGNGLAATADYVTQSPEVLTSFGKAYKQAVDFSADNADAVFEACAEYQPQEVEDRDYALALFEAIKGSLISPDSDPFGYNNPAYWEQVVADVAVTGDIQADDIVVDDLYTNEFVDGFNE